MCSSELSISMPLDDMLSLCFLVVCVTLGSIILSILSIFFRLDLRVCRFCRVHLSGIVVTVSELNGFEVQDVVLLLVASDELDEECDELKLRHSLHLALRLVRVCLLLLLLLLPLPPPPMLP